MSKTAGLTLKRQSFGGFPGYYLANQFMYAIVVPALGGRIMAFGKPGGANQLYMFEDLPGKKALARQCEELPSAELAKYRHSHPPIHYGGHKNWISPYEIWAGKPFLDLDNGTYRVNAYELTSGSIRLQLESPLCRETGMSIVRTVTLNDGDPYLHLDQQLWKRAPGEVRCGLWDVTQMDNPSAVYYGIRAVHSQHPRGVKNFATDAPLPAFVKSNGNLVAIETGKHEAAVKVGSDATAGWLLSCRNDPGLEQVTYTLKTFPIFQTKELPDDCTVEIYLFGDRPCVELEVLTPLTALRQGDCIEMRESWSLLTLRQAMPAAEIESLVGEWDARLAAD